MGRPPFVSCQWHDRILPRDLASLSIPPFQTARPPSRTVPDAEQAGYNVPRKVDA